MKKFQFPLDTVLSYKEQILDGLKAEHAAILAKVHACENEIARLERERGLCVMEFEQKKVRGMAIKDIRTYERYLEALRLKIRRKQAELKRLQDMEEIKRNEVVEARKETSSIEKLKEKRQQEYNKMVMKEEEQFIEEFVMTRRAMAKLNG